ncbi:MAG: hypothetical protein ACOYZ7_09370 [Chloroflexota bacterium]
MSSPDEARLQRFSLGLGLRNGLLMGLALALGAWLPDAIVLTVSRVRWVFPPLFLGLLALLALGALAGWLAARLGNAFGGGVIWALSGALMTWIIGHVPYEGRTLTIWLADRRFWGLPIYEFKPAAQARLVMAGFFVVLLLAILGLIQDYRLEGLRLRVDDRGRLEPAGWFGLLLPLPVILAVGLAADNLINSPLRSAPRLVHQAIRVGRTYAGDLFELSLEHGVNYDAIEGVRDQMSADYTLAIGQIDLGPSSTVFVVAHFDNGAWINCRVIADQLSHCYDASLPYQRGLPSLLTSGEIPADCRACTVQAGDEQQSWLAAHRAQWTQPLRVTRLAQWGSYVLLRAEPAAGGSAVDCFLRGISPVALERCQLATTR